MSILELATKVLHKEAAHNSGALSASKASTHTPASEEALLTP